MTRTRQPRLLTLDDDAEIGTIIASVAEKAGFEAIVTQTAEAFYATLESADPDVVVLDLQLPDTDGVELLRQLADKGNDAAIVLISGMDRRTIVAAEQYALTRGLKLLATLQKPFLPEDLLRSFLSIKSVTQPLGIADFSRAIQSGELEVHYQPVARNEGGRWPIDSVEALLRWEHPERGLLKPDAFLKLGESQGLGRDMTDFVIRTGLEQLKGWYARKLDLGLRVNVSAGLITDIEFPDRLHAALSEFEIPADALTIEVNETAMFAEQPRTYDILTRLRLKNIKLAIDDFGIGYSSLTQLFRMPFSEMKIDRTLIEHVATSREAAISVEALIELAHKLDLEVCGEGVEDRKGLEFLARAGVDRAQGYLLSPPVRGREIPDLVKRFNEARDEPKPEAGGMSFFSLGD